LPIIALEDALLHPALPLVAWLGMAQPKGYGVAGTAANALLKIVHQLAAVRVKDWLPPLASAAGGVGVAAAGGGDGAQEDEEEGPSVAAAAVAAAPPSSPLSLATADAQLRLPAAEAALIKSLLARAAYGGMGGDVAMLRGYASLWARRFSAGRGAGGEEAPPPLEAVWWGGGLVASGASPASSSSPGTQQQKQPAATAPSAWLSFCCACYAAAARVPMDGPPQQAAAAAAAAPAPPPSAGSGGVPPLTLIGPLDVRRGDIPLSAVDHHVSDVAARLLQEEEGGGGGGGGATAAAALHKLTASSWGADADEATLAARALWLFRSCASRKLLLPLARAAHEERLVVAGGGGAAAVLPLLPPPPPLLLPSLPPEIAQRLRRFSWGEPLAAEVDADAAQRERLLEFWRLAAPVADGFARAFLGRRFF
jgi:hypothetical protein